MRPEQDAIKHIKTGPKPGSYIRILSLTELLFIGKCDGSSLGVIYKHHIQWLSSNGAFANYRLLKIVVPLLASYLQLVSNWQTLHSLLSNILLELCPRNTESSCIHTIFKNFDVSCYWRSFHSYWLTGTPRWHWVKNEQRFFKAFDIPAYHIYEKSFPNVAFSKTKVVDKNPNSFFFLL